MFFYVGKEPKLNFSCFYQLGSFHISTDEGWHLASVGHYQCLYKGYADSGNLESLLSTIIDETTPETSGNFCLFVYDASSESIKIKSNQYRGFPIWFDPDGVTNLSKKAKTGWTDSLIEIKNDLSVAESKFDAIGDIDTNVVDLEHALDFIDQRLNQRTQNFVKHNQLPIKVYLSGGVDSLLVFSYLQKFTSNYELVRGQHFDYDKFWLLNSGTVKNNFWAYNQLHHWTDACVLTSGAPGDEFMLRSPATVDLFLKFYSQSALELIESDWQNCLHYDHFKKTKNIELFQTQILNLAWGKKTLFWNLCNIVLNDWQHWHLGKTLTWTPLRDIEIFKMLLRLPLPIAAGQIFNSNISKQLIERNYPRLTKVISDQKNSKNSLSNLCDFLLK